MARSDTYNAAHFFLHPLERVLSTEFVHQGWLGGRPARDSWANCMTKGQRRPRGWYRKYERFGDDIDPVLCGRRLSREGGKTFGRTGSGNVPHGEETAACGWFGAVRVSRLPVRVARVLSQLGRLHSAGSGSCQGSLRRSSRFHGFAFFLFLFTNRLTPECIGVKCIGVKTHA